MFELIKRVAPYLLAAVIGGLIIDVDFNVPQDGIPEPCGASRSFLYQPNVPVPEMRSRAVGSFEIEVDGFENLYLQRESIVCIPFGRIDADPNDNVVSALLDVIRNWEECGGGAFDSSLNPNLWTMDCLTHDWEYRLEVERRDGPEGR